MHIFAIAILRINLSVLTSNLVGVWGANIKIILKDDATSGFLGQKLLDVKSIDSGQIGVLYPNTNIRNIFRHHRNFVEMYDISDIRLYFFAKRLNDKKNI